MHPAAKVQHAPTRFVRWTLPAADASKTRHGNMHCTPTSLIGLNISATLSRISPQQKKAPPRSETHITPNYPSSFAAASPSFSHVISSALSGSLVIRIQLASVMPCFSPAKLVLFLAFPANQELLRGRRSQDFLLKECQRVSCTCGVQLLQREKACRPRGLLQPFLFRQRAHRMERWSFSGQ